MKNKRRFWFSCVKEFFSTELNGEFYLGAVCKGEASGICNIKKIVNKNNITDRYAIVETAVDFSKLDTVLVVMQ